MLAACDHPLTITTKGALIERDLDLLAPMAAKNLVRVFVSIAMLDRELARKLDPRAAAPHRRLQIVTALSDAGIPVGVNVAPIIPQLTDHELEAILEAAAAAGARHAGWTLLRLPLEVAPLFRDWLDAHYPLRAAHVMSIVQQIRGGRDNDPRFGARMRGQGEFADLIRKRFALACKRLGLNTERDAPLDTSRFRPPREFAPARSLLDARRRAAMDAPDDHACPWTDPLTASLTERLAPLLHGRGARRAADDGARQHRAAAGDQGDRAGNEARRTGVDRVGPHRPDARRAHETLLGWCTLLAKAPAGHVVVCQPNNHEVALMGELSAQTLQARGVLGYVVDGGSRDTDLVLAQGFPVFCSFLTPSDIVERWIPDRYGEPVTIGDGDASRPATSCSATATAS